MSVPSLSRANYPSPPPIPETEHVVKPKRSVSFKDHPDDHKTQTHTTVGLGRKPGKRAGYVRKGPVNSDSEDGDQDDDSEPEQEKDEEDVFRSVVPRRFDDNGSDDDEHKARVADIIYPLSQTRITKTAGPGQNYVRKAPVNSDTESDEESLDPKTTKDLQGSTPQPTRQPQMPGSPASQSSNSSSKSGARSFGVGRGSGPGQNYVRKAPVNSDTESDEEQKDKPASFSSGTTPQIDNAPITKPSFNNMLPAIDAGRPLSLMTSSATSSPIQSRVATPPTSMLHTPPQQYQQPYYQLPASAAVSAAVSAAMGQFQDSSVYPTYLPQSMPMHPPSALGSMPGSPAGLGLHGAHSPAAGLANSMALYQQQQAEMMLIMQQQQIQIATMQQQQQAYQMLILQQQQQALQQQQVQTTNRPNEDDSDDDVPLAVHQQQLPQVPQLPQLPQLGTMMGAVQAAGSPIASSGTSSPRQQPGLPAFAALPTVHLSPHLQHSTLAPPAHLYSPLQHSPLLHSRQASASSVHSIPYSSSPLAGKPLLSSPVNNIYQQHQHSHSQPRLQDFIDEERYLQEQQQQQSGYPASGGLLTSSFPAGYRHSIGSVSLSQLNLNLDHGSSNSLNSSGSNGYGHSPNHSQTHISVPGNNNSKPGARNSMMGPYPPNSSPLLGPYGGSSGVPAIPLIQQHTLIHVEAKPPPPQTGLVGAISAMERDKKLAKAQGSNQQLQQQQMYLQQQQQMQMQDKERWLQEQRRMVVESGGQFQQQPLYGVPTQGKQWNSEDDDDDNRPLGSH
ncbi:hypothetical protein CPC16_009676 [Podila verticillata]|nr:hypothetical protein CPC16_009676 [Podila verticillata]KAI9234228.1 MAG: hypothetical protein BYD32DRAFT_424006 [Podila humilis]